MPTTPYVVGQWVRGEKFYGRAVLIEEILEGPRNWIWLLGTRRIGKTSLLKQIEFLASSESPPRYFPVFWDFQGSDSQDELHEGFSEALLDAEERMARVGIAPGDVGGKDLFESLSRLRRRLRAQNLKLLLLCDEVEELLKLSRRDPAILYKIRRAMQAQDDIRSVLASTIKLWELAEQKGDTSPFLHGFVPPLYIHRLTDEEATALILQENLPSDSRPPVDDQGVRTIREECDNHPYLIQLVCKRFAEMGDLRESIEQVATDPMVSYFFSVDYGMLAEPERDILRIISQVSAANSNSIHDRIALGNDELGGYLFRLEQLGYLRRNRESRFELVNQFFRRWLKEQPASRGSGGGPPAAAARGPSLTTTRTDVEAGDVLEGRYHLERRIGEGAMGVVFKARDDVLRETIAVKVLKPQYTSSPEILERFRQEILLPRDIGHPNILKVYHLGSAAGRWYLTMKWIDGANLAQVIRRDGALAIRRAVMIACKLASALEAAHAHGVLHRDVKPQNVLMDDRDEPYLTDFGLARLLDAPGMTHPSLFVGTPDYASPEQARLEPLDARADIYALGVVLFEMVTGQRPFRGDSLNEILDKHRNAPPPEPRSLRHDVPRALQTVVLRCLEKLPAARYRDAQSVRTALEDLRDRL